MARHKNAQWNLPDQTLGWDQVVAAILMDVRDELQRLNSLLHCHNFTAIPQTLTAIRRNTTKRHKRKAASQ